MFNFYDFELTGRIRKHLAAKLFKNLGLDVPNENLPHVLTLNDVFLFADGRCPEKTIEGALSTTFRLASEEVQEGLYAVTSKSLTKFLGDLDRHPPTLAETNNLLSSLLEYDDCSSNPQVTEQPFSSCLSLTAKKFVNA